MENVAVLGASNKPDRYSYLAISELKKYNHAVYPIHPLLKDINGIDVYKDLKDIPVSIDTLTVYVNPTILEKTISDIISIKPKRVIMNPGTESELCASNLKKEGIKTVIGCTLVMLKTGQF